MSIRVGIGVFAILLLSACADAPPPPPPENALDEQKFFEVMVDVHLVEAAINQKFGRSKDTSDSSYGYYKALFEKHEVSRTDFDSTFNYYLRNPELLEGIYTQVHDSLSALSDDLEQNEEKYRKMGKAEADSLKELGTEKE